MILFVLKNVLVAACPADVIQEVKDICQYVCETRAGSGAVREFIDNLKE